MAGILDKSVLSAGAPGLGLDSPPWFHGSDMSDGSETVRPLRHPVKAKTVLHRRWATRWAAQLQTSDGRIACTVEDISGRGAKLKIGAQAIADETVGLAIGDLGSVEARLVWRRRDRAGIEFKSSQPWALDLVTKPAKDNYWPPRTAR